MERPADRGRIGVLIEAHFDETEFNRFNEVFPANGYELVYLSHLWDQPELTFTGNDNTAHVTVSQELVGQDPRDYRAIILIGGYAMDRLRYQEHPREGVANSAPAVEFLRKAVAAMDEGTIRIGTICHSLWLFCADPDLLKGRKVTCAHNIICDVENAGGDVVFEGDVTADLVIDGDLITGKHPGVVDQFMAAFVAEIEKENR